MKQLSITILLSCIFFLACKKKEKEKNPEPEKPVIVNPVLDEFSVKINGASFGCKRCSSSSSSGGMRSVTFTDQNRPNEMLRFDFSTMPALGSHVLMENGTPSLSYKANNNTIYPIKSGVLTITKIDTLDDGTIRKLTGTFTAKSDTTLQPPYAIYKFTKGKINLDK